MNVLGKVRRKPELSLVAEGTYTWQWRGVRIPRLGRDNRMGGTSFRYQDAEWFLQCVECDRFIYLWMYPKGRTPLNHAPFAISVWVQGAGYVFNGLSGAVDTLKGFPLIWKQETSEVERIVPGFSADRLLTFRIDIKEHDPQTGWNSASATAPHCPQFEVHAIVADASEQVRLTPNSISCLEALSEDFAKMMNADSGFDVELRCQGHSTRAYRSVLCSRSPVFARMLHSDMKEGRTGVVNIRDMDVDTFRQLLLYLYTGKLGEDALTFDLAISLYEAADMYEIVSLKTFCSDLLRAGLTLDNAYDVLAMADAYADTSFVEMVKSYIAREEVLQSTREIAIQKASSPLDEKKESPCTSASKTDLKFNDCTKARHSRTAAPRRTRACYCPQPEKHRHKTFADAFVQTNLTAKSIPCLEALSEDFSKMMDADSDPDVEIRCQGHSSWAHRSVLCSRSPVLERMLRSDMVEGRNHVLNIRDMDADIFRRVLLFLYTGKIEEGSLTLDSAMSLYKAAYAYGVVSLKTLCSDFLRAELTLDYAWKIFAAAEACADTSFAEAVTTFIATSLLS